MNAPTDGAAEIAGAAIALLAELAQLDRGQGVIVDRELEEAVLIEALAAQPGLIDLHAALGVQPAWHVLVLHRGRQLARAYLDGRHE